jgi:hypothetical protein
VGFAPRHRWRFAFDTSVWQTVYRQALRDPLRPLQSRTLSGVLVRRLLLLLAVLMVLTVVAGSIAPPPQLSGPSPTPTQPSIPRTPRAAPARDPDRADVRATLSSSPRRPARRIRARVGDSVAITVHANAIDTVELGELDVEPVEPGIPAHFAVLADDAGSYPLVMLQAGRRIGTLVVR